MTYDPPLSIAVPPHILDPYSTPLSRPAGGALVLDLTWTRPKMPRRVRDANLETRTARSRLSVAHKPYFRLIEPGLHLGFRKLASGPGTWVVRRYSGSGGYTVKNLLTADGVLVVADDFSEADGHGVVGFPNKPRSSQNHFGLQARLQSPSR